jgi:deoxyinosine 3'endonuclease (endonuclease V)
MWLSPCSGVACHGSAKLLIQRADVSTTMCARVCQVGRGRTRSEQQAAAGHTAKPIYVSVGHDVCLRSALALTLACCRNRVPEPVRLADLSGRAYIRRVEPPP